MISNVNSRGQSRTFIGSITATWLAECMITSNQHDQLYQHVFVKWFWLTASCFFFIMSELKSMKGNVKMEQNYLSQRSTKSGSDPEICLHYSLREELCFLHSSYVHMDGPCKDNIHLQALTSPLFQLSLCWSLEFLGFTWRLFKRLVYLCASSILPLQTAWAGRASWALHPTVKLKF